MAAIQGGQMTPEEARNQVEISRRAAEMRRSALIIAIKNAWAKRAEEMVTSAVYNQPDVTTGLGAAELGVLKANLALVISAGEASIDSIYDRALDLEELASKARIGTTGAVNPNIAEPTRELTRPLHDLLAKAGYKTQPLKRSQGDYAIDNLSPADINLAVHSEERAYGNAAETYGKALLQLETAEREVAVEKARNLWDSV